MTFSNVEDIVGRVAHNKDVINITRTLVTTSPDLIFEDCKFDNAFFIPGTVQTAGCATNPTLFLNCDFQVYQKRIISHLIMDILLKGFVQRLISLLTFHHSNIELHDLFF